MLVMDAMVLIHLAKLTLLENGCDYYGEITIPRKVHEEVVVEGKRNRYEDAFLIEELVGKNKIRVIDAEEKLVDRANKFNIQSGEAHAVALYWENNASFLATDDDSVRKKKTLLNLNLIGTPVIILKLYREGRIDNQKFKLTLKKLKEIGWFSTTVIDKIMQESEGGNYA